MTRWLMAGLMVLTVAAWGAEDDVLVLKKGATASGPAYEGGIVRFLDVTLADQLVHYPEPGEIPLRLSIAYEVLETAPVSLNSSMGTEYWRLHHFGNDQPAMLHTWENIDVSKAGEATTSVERAVPDEARAPAPFKGLVGILGHYYFLIQRPDGQIVGAIKPPAFFDRAEITGKLHFTLANLTEYSLQVAECQSSWEAGGTFRVRVSVTDADGDSFDVVQMPLTAWAGGWQAQMTTQLDYSRRPTGWMVCTLGDQVPDEIAVSGTVSIMAPDGPTTQDLAATFARGTGRTAEEQMSGAAPIVALPRNADGVIRETRAVCMWGSEILTPEACDAVVARCKEAGFNVIIPSTTGSDKLLATSELWPERNDVPEGYDPLGYLIQKAHEVGIEVHPWFSVMYRRQGFRDRFPVDINIRNRDGSIVSSGADVHRPEFRDYMVSVMLDVAKTYEVDGILLDYIRIMTECYCEKCQAEFQAQFGKPLAEATDEERIAWHRQAVGDIVRRTHEGLAEIRPEAKLWASIFSTMSAGALQGQDGPTWAAEGWLDVVTPMDYKVQTVDLITSEREWLEALADDDKLAPALSLYLHGGTGGTLLRSPELVAEQITALRVMGMHGYALFRYGLMGDELLEKLRTEVNPEPAVPYFR